MGRLAGLFMRACELIGNAAGIGKITTLVWHGPGFPSQLDWT